MLHSDVIDAVKEGKFHIWPVSTIEEGVEILTGMKAGVLQEEDNTYPEGTLFHRVDERLMELSEIVQKLGKDTENGKRGEEAPGVCPPLWSLTEESIMLLSGYDINIIRPKSNRSMENIFCIAILNEDVSQALPYLNTVLRGLQYTKDPPALMFKQDGKVIVIRPGEIAINSVEDEADAERSLQWLKDTINDTWQRRADIEPTFEPVERPQIIQIMRLLAQTNCRECGEPSCVVFAVQLAEGVKEPEDCPLLDEELKEQVQEYLHRFDR